MTVGTHPVREGLNRLDGTWYAADPHPIWAWMRRQAPVYHDEASDVGERSLGLPREPNADKGVPFGEVLRRVSPVS
jgi:hypothetical protein